MTEILKAASERVVGLLLPKVEAGACHPWTGDCCWDHGMGNGVITCDGRCKRGALC